MSSVGARLMGPMIRMMGRQLRAAATPEQARAVSVRWTSGLPPAFGVPTERTSLGGVPALRADGRGGRQTARAILLLHGGGYVFGSARTYRALATRLAKMAEASVWAIDYRLAPEHPYPAAVEDALAAYRALLERHGPEHIALIGDSAGGGLAVATLHRARDSGLPRPGCAVLLSPWLDLTGGGASMRTNASREMLIPHPVPERMARWYAAAAELDDPGVSPLFGRHDDLPPVQVQASASELLFSDSERFVERARAAGVAVTFWVEPDMWHVWPLMAPLVAEARHALAAAARFIMAHTRA